MNSDFQSSTSKTTIFFILIVKKLSNSPSIALLWFSFISKEMAYI